MKIEKSLRRESLREKRRAMVHHGRASQGSKHKPIAGSDGLCIVCRMPVARGARGKERHQR